MRFNLLNTIILGAALFPAIVSAQGVPIGDSAKLIATGGVSQVEGAGGGGLSAWALISGYGSDRSIGANAHYTHVILPDYTLRSAGAAIGLFDRVEVSYAHSWFDTGDTGAALGLGQGYTFEQDVVGVKVRLVGDAIYDQDKWLPQIAAGVQYKNTSDATVLAAVGARRDDDVDFYVAASKLFLGQSVLANATLRYTRANQFGILGYGGDANDDRSVQFEGSLVYLIRRNLAAGVEYRTKPDNLGFAAENDAFDIFGAWFINKHVSLTAAYADLGSIALQDNQRGAYLSLQVGF
ncbi:DUF3034 family protein [Hyphococcus sp.]|uniref:DUF3034 family protein n=1 Tax=Hyphococcus sp. TaxID=2038636 RepID=UPI003CCB8856